MGVHYHPQPTDRFSSEDLPDVNPPVVCSGANNFDFPYYEIGPETEDCGCTADAAKAFFSQPRRSG